MKSRLLLELSEVFHREALVTPNPMEARRLEGVSDLIEKRAADAFKRACIDCDTQLDEDEAITCSACEREERAELAAAVVS